MQQNILKKVSFFVLISCFTLIKGKAIDINTPSSKPSIPSLYSAFVTPTKEDFSELKFNFQDYTPSSLSSPEKTSIFFKKEKKIQMLKKYGLRKIEISKGLQQEEEKKPPRFFLDDKKDKSTERGIPLSDYFLEGEQESRSESVHGSIHAPQICSSTLQEIISKGYIQSPNRKRRLFSIEEKEKIAHLYEQGKSVTQISREVNRIRRSVLDVVNNIFPDRVKHEKSSPEEKKMMKQLYQKGISIREISEIFGYSKRSTYDRIVTK